MSGVRKDQLALKGRREELEKFLFAAPAKMVLCRREGPLPAHPVRPDTAADDPRYQTLIEELLADFDRLLSASANDKNPSPAG